MQYSSWEADDDTKRSKVKVVVENAQFLPDPTRGSSQTRPETRSKTTEAAPTRAVPGAVVDEADFEDLPF